MTFPEMMSWEVGGKDGYVGPVGDGGSVVLDLDDVVHGELLIKSILGSGLEAVLLPLHSVVLLLEEGHLVALVVEVVVPFLVAHLGELVLEFLLGSEVHFARAPVDDDDVAVGGREDHGEEELEDHEAHDGGDEDGEDAHVEGQVGRVVLVVLAMLVLARAA